MVVSKPHLEMRSFNDPFVMRTHGWDNVVAGRLHFGFHFEHVLLFQRFPDFRLREYCLVRQMLGSQKLSTHCGLKLQNYKPRCPVWSDGWIVRWMHHLRRARASSARACRKLFPEPGRVHYCISSHVAG